MPCAPTARHPADTPCPMPRRASAARTASPLGQDFDRPCALMRRPILSAPCPKSPWIGVSDAAFQCASKNTLDDGPAALRRLSTVRLCCLAQGLPQHRERAVSNFRKETALSAPRLNPRERSGARLEFLFSHRQATVRNAFTAAIHRLSAPLARGLIPMTTPRRQRPAMPELCPVGFRERGKGSGEHPFAMIKSTEDKFPIFRAIRTDHKIQSASIRF